jgi:hypothetical protein
MPYGSLYYGKTGFFYKKMGGGGVSRIPQVSCNASSTAIYSMHQQYISGAGVGASSVATRRAKRLRSTTGCNGFCNQNINVSLPDHPGWNQPISFNYYIGPTLHQKPRLNLKGTSNQVVYNSSDGLAFI